MVGDGIAIIPDDGEVVARFKGEVVSVFPTKHAIGLKNEAGVEVLIHIGLETVALKGEGFQTHVEQGDKVELGQRLITFDLKTIEKKAKHMIIPIIMTNSKSFPALEKVGEQKVLRGESPVLFITTDDESKTMTKHQTSQLYQQEAHELIQAIGGKENIEKMTHCVTRLRFALRDDAKINQAQLECLKIVKGTFSANGQYQVVIGQGTVDKVYEQ